MKREIVFIGDKSVDITDLPFHLQETMRDIPFLIDYLNRGIYQEEIEGAVQEAQKIANAKN